MQVAAGLRPAIARHMERLYLVASQVADTVLPAAEAAVGYPAAARGLVVGLTWVVQIFHVVQISLNAL